jgi:ElaB/YqjD/DUF883 family membrane-anchored ribosome-binding protein
MAMASKRDLRHLRHDLSSLADKVMRLSGHPDDHAFGDVRDRLRRAGSDLGDTFSNATSQARDVGREAFRDVRESMHDAVGSRLRDHPYMAIAIAAGLGLILSAIFRRR